MNIPETLKYTESHEWILLEGESATVGITDHAQNELSDVVFVELPKVGRSVNAKEPVAVVESVKAASDIYSPLSGEITATNPDLTADPALVNSDPYGKAWIFKIRLANPSEASSLLDARAYTHVIRK
ncbi:MAG: glycine cleavage system protein GcvH [Candidatus Methylacidiphilales bacterium]|nr:glycine cleavage system protein GcvH [Candidatus Methylacidiphilales bacterium]